MAEQHAADRWRCEAFHHIRSGSGGPHDRQEPKDIDHADHYHGADALHRPGVHGLEQILE